LHEIDNLIGDMERKEALVSRIASVQQTPDSILTKTSIQLDYFANRMKEMQMFLKQK